MLWYTMKLIFPKKVQEGWIGMLSADKFFPLYMLISGKQYFCNVIYAQMKAVSIWAFSKPARRKHKNGNNQMVA